MATPAFTLGVISDTHGLLRPEAMAALRGSDLILHAGDVGKPQVLDGLRKIAPVVAVRGNVDAGAGAWADALPLRETVEVAGLSLYLLHNVGELALDPTQAGFAAVVFGHSHQPTMERRDGVLYFNPGGAGPRRFKLPIAVGRLLVRDGGLRGEIIHLVE